MSSPIAFYGTVPSSLAPMEFSQAHRRTTLLKPFKCAQQNCSYSSLSLACSSHMGCSPAFPSDQNVLWVCYIFSHPVIANYVRFVIDALVRFFTQDPINSTCQVSGTVIERNSFTHSQTSNVPYIFFNVPLHFPLMIKIP